MKECLTRWWWVRHAVVTVNEGRIYGSDDLPCDVSDEATFKGLAHLLPKQALVINSALQRTHQTTEAIRKAGLALTQARIEPDLNEQSFGEWQGKDYQQVQKDYGKIADHDYWLCPAHMRPQGGESFVDLIARTAPAIEKISNQIADEQGEQDIISVGHGGTIRAALSIALGMNPERALGFMIDNLSVTRIDRIEKEGRLVWRVMMVNHLPTYTSKMIP